MIQNYWRSIFNPIPPRRGSLRLPSIGICQYSYRIGILRLETLWQFHFMYSPSFWSISFKDHYKKFIKFKVWKFFVPIFLLQSFFSSEKFHFFEKLICQKSFFISLYNCRWLEGNDICLLIWGPQFKSWKESLSFFNYFTQFRKIIWYLPSNLRATVRI